MPEVALIAFVVATFNLAHRLLLLPTSPMTFDSWGHLYLALEVKRRGAGPFGPIYPRVVGGEKFHYPLLLHWLYGFLPQQLLRHHNHLINPVIESVFLGAFSAVLWFAGWPMEVILLSAALYILTPLWFSKLSTGPRVLNFTTRIYSEVAFPIALGFALMDLGLPVAVSTLIAALLLAFVLLGSKFGVQAVVLVTPIAGTLTLSWNLLVAWGLAFPLALIISKGAITEQLRQQAAHLKWYLDEVRLGRMPIAGRNSCRFLLLWSRTRPAAANMRKLIFSWFARNSFSGVLLRAPHVPISLVLLIVSYSRGISIPEVIWGPVAAAVSVYFLTSLRWLLFLGEAERYLSHVSIFTNLLFVLLCLSLNVGELIGIVAAYGLLYTLGELIFLKKGVQPFDPKVEDNLIGYLQRLKEVRRIVVFPYHVVPPYRIMLDTEHETVFPWLAGSRHKSKIKEVEDYPYLDLHRLDRLVELTGADLLIISSSERAGRLSGWTAPNSWVQVDLGFGCLEVYERQNSSFGAGNGDSSSGARA